MLVHRFEMLELFKFCDLENEWQTKQIGASLLSFKEIVMIKECTKKASWYDL